LNELLDQLSPLEIQAPPPSSERVAEAILKFHKKNVEMAALSTAALWQDIIKADTEYDSCKRQSGQSQKATDAEIDVPEAPNQADIVTVNFMDNLFQNGEMYIVAARGGEEQERADTAKEVMDSLFERNDVYHETELAAHRFVNYRLAGCKTVLELKESVEGERVSMPPDPLAIAELQQLGADNGVPVRQASLETPDPNDPDFVTGVNFEIPQRKTEWNVYYRAIEMRNISFSDLASLYRTSDVHKQHSVHEYHYWTREEMEDVNSFRNLDKLGKPDAGTRRHPEQTSTQTGEAVTVENENFQPHEIMESWARLPVNRWLENGDVTAEELAAFAAEFEFDVNEFYTPQKFCVFHDKKATTVLKCYPNYIKRKLRYPHNVASYYIGGSSYLDRILPGCKASKVLKNLYLFNVKARAKGGVFVDKTSDIDVNIIRKIMFEDGGVGDVEFGSKPIDQQLIFAAEKMPDVAPAIIPMINLLKADSETFGTPGIMSGFGTADEATTNAINNSRGQQKLNNPYRRFVVRMLKECWTDCHDVMFLNFTDGQWINVAGEAGVMMSRVKFVTPDQISNRFEIIPTATFDFADRNTKAQQLIAMLNVDARTSFMTPETYFKQKAGILEYMGFPRKQANEWTNNAGVGTDPMEEIKAMIENEQVLPQIRPDDPHEICLMLAQDAIMQDQLVGEAQAMGNPEAAGIEFKNLGARYNFTQYIKMHQMYLVIMQAQQAQAQAEQAGPDDNGNGGDKKTAPQNNPNPPTTQEGTEARQPGQFNSAPDGGMSAMGMTGQGGMAAMGGQYPNSISGMINNPV
jgi:hypothetical protein